MGEIRKIVPVYIMDRKSKNYGKKCGVITYRDGMESYYYVEKSGQHLWRNPAYIHTICVSKEIIEMLIEKGINKIVLMISGFEKNSFFIAFNTKEFLEGELIHYDDNQYRLSWKDRPRVYDIRGP